MFHVCGRGDPDALREKYARERAKRLRADGGAQYIEVKGQFAHFADDDPYADPKFKRTPVSEELRSHTPIQDAMPRSCGLRSRTRRRLRMFARCDGSFRRREVSSAASAGLALTW